jgi:hypothetical protein
MLVVLALVVTMFVVAVPVMASNIQGSKTTSPTSPNIYYVGDTIHWVVTITNPLINAETNTLTRVWDTLPDGTVVELISSDVIQAPGDSDSWDVYYTVNATDLVTLPTGWLGVRNQAEAQGYDTAGDGVYTLTQRNSRVIQPDICIEKTVDCNNDGVFKDEDMGYAGDTAHWRIVVTNCGDSELTTVMTSDTNGQNYGPTTLASGANVTYEYDTVVSVNTTNNVTVEATDLLAGTVSDWDIATNNVISPDICVEKTVDCDDDGEFLDEDTGYAGDTAHWKVVVSNCGDSDLTNVIVTDSNGHDFGPAFNLTAGAAPVEFNYDTTVNVDTTNNATVTATHAQGGTVSDWDIATNNVISPDTSVTISANVTQINSGDPVALTITETNGGDVDLTNPYVELYEDGTLIATLDEDSTEFQGGDGPDLGVLDAGSPGETWTWEYIVNPTVDTTYRAIGHGTDPLGNDITWCLDPGNPPADTVCDQDEMAEATVQVISECTGCLKICKYEDKNGNGIKDCGEPYLSGWEFTITNDSGYSKTVTTAGSGGTCCSGCDYCVTIWDLAEGEYTVTEVTPLPIGWTNTDPGHGSYQKTVYVPCYEADALCDGGCELRYGCGGGGDCSPKCPTVVEFGNQRECFGCLKICKYEDKDGDGQKDYGEPYLSGWVFNVTGPEGYSELVTTGGSGGTCGSCDYCKTICDLALGQYNITEVTLLPAGWMNTDPGGDPPYVKTVTVECDRTSTVKFGNQGPCSGCLKIYKYNDKNRDGTYDPGRPYYESYLSGWVFTVTDSAGNIVGSGTTNWGGYVTICGLAPGVYTVTETPKDGWTNTDPGGGILTKTVEVRCGTTTTVKFGNKRVC